MHRRLWTWLYPRSFGGVLGKDRIHDIEWQLRSPAARRDAAPFVASRRPMSE